MIFWFPFRDIWLSEQKRWRGGQPPARHEIEGRGRGGEGGGKGRGVTHRQMGGWSESKSEAEREEENESRRQSDRDRARGIEGEIERQITGDRETEGNGKK